MPITESEITGIEKALDARFPAGRWLAVLTVLQYTGVADRQQILEETNLSRDRFLTFESAAEELAPGDLLKRVPFPVHRPGRPGRPPTVYTLGSLGAALLRAHGFPKAHACGLKTETALAHAREMLTLRQVADTAGLRVVLDSTLPYGDGDEHVLRPDARIILPDGTIALYEIEQHADLTVLRRLRDSVRHKVAFFQDAAGQSFSSTVRVLINLPNGNSAWDETVAAWEQATAIVAEEQDGELPVQLIARSIQDFVAEPDWNEPPSHEEWESLLDPAQLSSFTPVLRSEANAGSSSPSPTKTHLPRGLKRRSTADTHLIMLAYWQYLQETGPDLLRKPTIPRPHPAFFATMRLIHAASFSPDATPWERAAHPAAGLYLIQRYLDMHTQLRKALSKALRRGGGSLRWSTPTITHRMQCVIDTFLKYHGFQSRGTLFAAPLPPWERKDGRGEFGVQVRLHRELLMGERDGVVPTREDVQAAEIALGWVLYAIFAYGREIGLKTAPFW
jgi:hypothetical protein